MAELCDIGLIGLAVMGENLALNIESRGYRVAVFNRTTSEVDEFIAGRAKGKKFVGCHSLEELVDNLANAAQGDDDGQGRPGGRRAHRAADAAALAGRRHHRRRQHATTPTPSGARKYVEAKGLLYVGTGVSGGEEGALQGPEHDARRQRRPPGRWSSRSFRRSPPRSGRRTTFPAANGSARAAPGTT